MLGVKFYPFVTANDKFYFENAFQVQMCSLSSWKYQLNPIMISKSISVPQHHNPIQPMIYSNQFKDQKKFQRFFTKSTVTSTQPENEQEIFHQVTNLLDGTNGYPKDPIKAASLLKKLADNGSTRAMMMYAGMAESGRLRLRRIMLMP